MSNMKKILVSSILLIWCIGSSVDSYAQTGMAAKLLPQANRGVASKLSGLAECYEYGYGVDVNYNEALRLHKEAAFRGSSDSKFRIGALHKYGFGGIKQDYELAFKYLSEACNEGCSGAYPYLAEFYENGWFVGKDLNQAIKYYYLSGKDYFEKAKKCEKLAGVDSAGTPGNFMEGYLRYAEGAEGDARAMYALSERYRYGLNGVEKNIDLGIEWLKRAAEKGLTIAMFELGEYYNSKEDFETAIKYLEPCSLRGHQESMGSLAFAYTILQIKGVTIPEGLIPNLYIAAGDFDAVRSKFPSIGRASDAELLNKQISIYQNLHSTYDGVQGSTAIGLPGSSLTGSQGSASSGSQSSASSASQGSAPQQGSGQSTVNQPSQQPSTYQPSTYQPSTYQPPVYQQPAQGGNTQQRQPVRVLCSHCNGSGYQCVVNSVPTYGTHTNVKTRCKYCSELLDHGIVHIRKKCPFCQGKGYVER